MGKVMSLLSKPIRNYNIESRIQKVISKDKPVPAPKHKSDVIDYERILREYPDLSKELQTKHEVLDSRLRDVFVVSHDPVSKHVQQEAENSERPLPLNRKIVEDFDYGFKEPEKVPLGRVTLRNALKFINDNQSNPKEYSAVKIANEYLLPEETVRNVLNYFKVYEVYIPEQKKTRASFMGPKVPRYKIQSRKVPQLTEGKVKKDEI